MKLNPIQIILDDNGVMVDEYTILPSINQYATNYELNVAFLNDNDSARNIKAIFTINGKASPAKVLSPTLERIDLKEGVRSYYKHSFQLTQYETQFYQPELRIDIYVYNDTNSQIANTSVSLPMNKQNFNKLTPADLDSESSINSVVDAIYDLEAAVIKNVGVNAADFETKAESEAKLAEAKKYTDDKVNTVKEDIVSNYATISYVNTQDNKTYKKAQDYTDEVIARLTVAEDSTLGLAKNYTDNEISEHNASKQSHPDIRTALNTKVNQSFLTDNYYTKQIVDNKFATFDIKNQLDGYATEIYVDNKLESTIEEVIGAAPQTLDTLNELAKALGNDPNFATTITEELSKKVNNTDYTNKVEEIDQALVSANAKIDTKANKVDLAEVAFSGQFKDILGAPAIISDAIVSGLTLNLVRSSGEIIEYRGLRSYSQLTDKPTFIAGARINGNFLTLVSNDGSIIEFEAMKNFEDLYNIPKFYDSVSIAGDTITLGDNKGDYIDLKVVIDYKDVLNTPTKLSQFQDDLEYLAHDTDVENLDIEVNARIDSEVETLNQTINTTSAADRKYTDDSIANLVDSSPETLNTLNELAQALGDDPNFATTITNSIATKVAQTEYNAKIQEIDQYRTNNDNRSKAIEDDLSSYKTSNDAKVKNLEDTKANDAELAVVAKTGSYEDLVDEPHVLSYFNNDIKAYTPETIVYSETEPTNPTQDMIWLDPSFVFSTVTIRTWED